MSESKPLMRKTRLYQIFPKFWIISVESMGLKVFDIFSNDLLWDS